MVDIKEVAEALEGLVEAVGELIEKMLRDPKNATDFALHSELFILGDKVSNAKIQLDQIDLQIARNNS